MNTKISAVVVAALLVVLGEIRPGCGALAAVSRAPLSRAWDAELPAGAPATLRSESRVAASDTMCANPSLRPTAAKTSDSVEIQAACDLYAALNSGDARRREQAFRTVLPVLVALDPDAVAYMAETWERGPVRAEFLRRTALAWAKLDWPGSVVWIAELDDRTERMQALAEVTAQVGRDDVVAARAIQSYFGM